MGKRLHALLARRYRRIARPLEQAMVASVFGNPIACEVRGVMGDRPSSRVIASQSIPKTQCADALSRCRTEASRSAVPSARVYRAFSLLRQE